MEERPWTTRKKTERICGLLCLLVCNFHLVVISMSAIFDFGSLLTVLLLLICTCAYIREMRPTIFDPSPAVCWLALLPSFVLVLYFILASGWFSHKKTCSSSHAVQPQQNGQPPPQQQNGRPKREGVSGFLWKLSRIGERLSPYVGAGCLIMAVHILFFK